MTIETASIAQPLQQQQDGKLHPTTKLVCVVFASVTNFRLMGTYCCPHRAKTAEKRPKITILPNVNVWGLLYPPLP